MVHCADKLTIGLKMPCNLCSVDTCMKSVLLKHTVALWLSHDAENDFINKDKVGLN